MRANAALLLLALVLGLPAPARAALFTVDLLGGNPDEVTRDSLTSLDWLDLTETMTVSYDNAVAFADGNFGAGWRHATGLEVCALFANYALDPQCSGSPPTGGATDFGPPHTENDLLFSMLGITLPQGGVDLSQALYDDQAGAANLAGKASFRRELINVPNTSTQVFVDAAAKDLIHYATGQFLVRAVVPEPSAALLVGLGLLGLGIRTRRS